MDTVFIKDFRADAWIGIYEWEKQRPQTLELQIEIGVDTHKATASDRIHDTVDYAKVVERVQADLAQSRFKLIETLAEHIAKIILHDFKGQWVKVSVAKIAHLRNVRTVGVTITRP